ncbi:MAG: histidine kinase, partial [Lachnospiraceae bacterium]|nr:histidine kinase [Lachnospiraceae bacterium]
MLVLIGVCGITAFFVMITRTLSKRRKLSLLLVEIFCTILLVSDRLAYLYRGDVSRLGYWMVRISNFTLFLMTLSIVYAISLYITDLLMNECSLKERPLRSVISYTLIVIDLVMLIISQFTGGYYTFEETNHYVRAPLFLISYIHAVVVIAIQLLIV